MAAFCVEVSVPADISHSAPLLPVFVYLKVCFLFFVTAWNLKPIVPTITAEPNFICHEEGQYLLVFNGV